MRLSGYVGWRAIPPANWASRNSVEDFVIWKRTSAGKAELKLGHGSGLRAAAQNLLMILDGVKTEEMLLRNLVGVTREDFRSLVRLGLIEPANVIAAASSTVGATEQAPSTGVPAPTGLDKRFAAVLANVIKTHLGLGGFRLLNACENAVTTAELYEVARMAIELIQQRKGGAAAGEARLQLERSATNFGL